MSPSIVKRSSYRIASIPADGIGPEVIEAGTTVLKKLASTLDTFDLEFTNFDWSSDTYKKTGKYMPDDGLKTLKTFDAILFGAVGAPGKYERPELDYTCLICFTRCPRSHLPLATPSSNLPTPPTIRQRPSHQGLPRHPVPPQKLQTGRPKLGNHPRKQRGRIRWSRRAFSRWATLGSLNRSIDFHTPWSGETYALCV
jgi:hypothetical protein